MQHVPVDALYRRTKVDPDNSEAVDYGYDWAGNLTSILDDGGSYTNWEYDPRVAHLLEGGCVAQEVSGNLLGLRPTGSRTVATRGERDSSSWQQIGDGVRRAGTNGDGLSECPFNG